MTGFLQGREVSGRRRPNPIEPVGNLAWSHRSAVQHRDAPSIMRSLYKAEPLSEVEWIRLSGFLLGAMRQREYEWFQMRDGSIDESLWKAYRRVIAVHLGNARVRKWWDTWGNVPFDPQFCAMVRDFLEEQPLSDYFQTFEKLVADADRGPGVAA